MKKSKYTESQIVFALHQAETGTKVGEVCRKMGISEATFYNWKKKYEGLGTSELRPAGQNVNFVKHTSSKPNKEENSKSENDKVIRS